MGVILNICKIISVSKRATKHKKAFLLTVVKYPNSGYAVDPTKTAVKI